MNNYIDYYYNLYPNTIEKVGRNYRFFLNNEKYYIIMYERNLEEMDTLVKLNKEMIDDGKKLIEDIDKRLKKLDDISDKDLEKSDAEFRRLVGDHIVLEKEGDHEFRKILRKLDKELNIERKSPEK